MTPKYFDLQLNGYAGVDFNRNDLTPDDVKALVAWVHEYRRDHFDVVVSGATPDPEKGCDIVAPFIEAGATWWSENINGLRAPFNEMRTRIQKGPPEV